MASAPSSLLPHMKPLGKSCQLRLQNPSPSGPRLTLELPPPWSNSVAYHPGHSSHGGWQLPRMPGLFPQAARGVQLEAPGDKAPPLCSLRKKAHVFPFGPPLPLSLLGSLCSSDTGSFTLVLKHHQANPTSGSLRLLFPGPGPLFRHLSPAPSLPSFRSFPR